MKAHTHKFLKATSAVMALMMAATALTGCGGNTDGSSGDSDTADVTEYMYVASYTPMSEDIDYINSSCYANGRIYFTSNIKDGVETYTDPTTGESYEYDNYRIGLFSMAEDGSDIQELTGYEKPAIPEGAEGDTGLNTITADADGGLWVVEYSYIYTYDLPEGFDESVDNKWNYQSGSEETFFVRKLAPDGSELANLDISGIKGDSDNFYIGALAVDSSGNAYISTSEAVYVVAPDGTALFSIDVPTWVNGMFRLADGSVAISTSNEDYSKSIIAPIDVAAKGFGESVDAPVNAYNFYNGGGEYDFYYNTDSNFFGYDMDTAQGTKILNWINCDINSNNLGLIIPLDDGRILCTNYDYDTGNDSGEIITLTKTPYDQVTQKTIITYACMYMDYNVRSQIIKFNKTNDTYRIEVKDYSEYNTQEDYSAGLTKLTTEIISGQVPDIIDTNSMPLNQFAAKGLLEDLWPYIDADEALGGRDALLTPVFTSLEDSEGKLYQICPNFSVYTVVGAASVVGTQPGWTLDQLYAALAAQPEGTEIFSQGTTKASVLSQCCYMSLDDMVNWETGECTFDSQEFVDILSFANMFPETFDWENMDWETDYDDEGTRIMEGRQMLAIMYGGSFDNFTQYKSYFGGDMTFIGFPSTAGNGSAFSMGSGLAMSSACDNKDGAWQFMRIFLTEDYQSINGQWSFSTNKNVFEQSLKDAMTPQYYTDPETGVQVEQPKYTMGWEGGEVSVYAMTQAEADQITDLIDATTRVYSYDDTLFQIISDEAEAYFSGQKSAEDVAALIQSRVSIYVNEQR